MSSANIIVIHITIIETQAPENVYIDDLPFMFKLGASAPNMSMLFMT